MNRAATVRLCISELSVSPLFVILYTYVVTHARLVRFVRDFVGVMPQTRMQHMMLHGGLIIVFEFARDSMQYTDG